MDIEERAQQMGWVPEDKFRGDPDKWVPAEKFVERADNIMPIMKAQNKRYEEKLKEQSEALQATTKEISELKTTLNKVVKINEKVSEREYERALETIRKEQRDAIENSDGARFAELERDKDKLLQSKPEKIDVPEDPGQPKPDPSFDAWVVNNEWYKTDAELRDYADFVAERLAKENPSLFGEPFFNAVKEKVKVAMPHKFENPNRQQAAAVDSGSGSGGENKSKKKTYRDLPKEARAACDRLVEDELMSKEDYVKEYFADEVD